MRNHFFFESKKDKEDLEQYLGKELFAKYCLIRNKIPNSKEYEKYRNFELLKKMDIEDIREFIDNFNSNMNDRVKAKSGAKKLYEDENWYVYRISTYPAAKYYGRNTKWCISGNFDGEEGRGRYYFFEYIEVFNLDGGYYFYISKNNDNIKYCVLQSENREIVSIWNSNDINIGTTLKDLPSDFPIIKEVNLKMDSLYSAIEHNNLELLEEILLKEKDANIYSIAGNTKRTILDYVLRNSNLDNQLEIIKLFIENGKIDCSYADEFIKLIDFIIENGNDYDKKEFNSIMENLLFSSKNNNYIPYIKFGKGNDILKYVLDKDDLPYNIVEWILSIPKLDLNEQNDSGLTASHYISKVRDVKTLRLFFEYSPEETDLNILDNWGISPLEYAMEENNNNAVELFRTYMSKTSYELKESKRRNNMRYSFLEEKINNKYKLFEYDQFDDEEDMNEEEDDIIDNKFQKDYDEYKKYHLDNVVSLRKILFYDRKLSNGYKIYTLSDIKEREKYIEYNKELLRKHSYLLTESLEYEEINIAKKLIECGVDINIHDYKGDTALFLAIRKDYKDIIELLLEHGANPNEPNNNGITSLEEACLDGNFSIVKTLLKHGADPNIQDYDGGCALIESCKSGESRIVKLLLEHGSNPNLKDDNGNTAILEACMRNYTEIVKLLLSYKANPNVINEIGDTPIDFAVCRGNKDIVELLLENDADPNIRCNQYENTPLMDACLCKRNEIIKLLLDHGADPKLTNGDDETVLELAKLLKNEEAVKIILKYMQ